MFDPNQGPSWGQFHVERSNHNIAQGNANKANARAAEYAEVANQWMAKTKKLEIELERVWDLYQDMSAAVKGQANLKVAALAEIGRLDPSSKMLKVEYRTQLYDEAHKAHFAAKHGD